MTDPLGALGNSLLGDLGNSLLAFTVIALLTLGPDAAELFPTTYFFVYKIIKLATAQFNNSEMNAGRKHEREGRERGKKKRGEKLGTLTSFMKEVMTEVIFFSEPAILAL